MVQSWDASHKNAAITISGATSLIATDASGGSATWVKLYATATPGMAAGGGKYYWEMTNTTMVSQTNFGVGATTDTTSTGGVLGDGTTSLGYRSSDGLVFNNGGSLGTWSTYVQGDTIGVAWDLINNKVSFRIYHSGAWGAWQGSYDTNAGTGGIAIPSTVTANTMIPGAAMRDTTAVVTAAFAVADIIGPAPSGFTLYDPTVTVTLPAGDWIMLV